MTQCVINGTSVSFPFEPYKVQEDYMDKVITCLKQVIGIIKIAVVILS